MIKDKSRNKTENQQQKKIFKDKTWFFEKTNKINKPLAIPNEEKKRKQIINIKNERGFITTDSINISSKYYDPLYTNKFNNLDERDKFLKNIIYQNWNKKRKFEQSHNK